MQPRLEHLFAFSVAGLTERTSFRAERDPSSARISHLWGRFFDENAYERPARTPDLRLFGVYSDYDTREDFSFDVTAGVAVAEGQPAVRIEAGDYLVFSGQGPMPELVLGLWEEVERYFARHPELRRRYRSDFEAYSGPDAVALHIGVERDAH